MKHVYTHHKQIRILGISFGSQIVAKALGGLVEPVNPSNAGNIGAGIFIGKKVVTVNDDFWAQPYVKEVIEPLISSKKEKE